MNTTFVLLMGLATLLLLRMLIWLRLLQLTALASKPRNLAASYISKYGHTVGDLENAGVYEEFQDLEAQAGKVYRQAVPLAAMLMWWPIGPWFCKKSMTEAYDKVGLFKGASGSFEAWRDVRRGFANDTGYYPVNHMTGLLTALETARPLL